MMQNHWKELEPRLPCCWAHRACGLPLVSLHPGLETGDASPSGQPATGFCFLSKPCPPEALSLEIWMAISSLPLPPSIILCRCKLSWKRHLAACPLGPGTGDTRVLLTLVRWPWGRGILQGLPCHSSLFAEGGSWFCWCVCGLPRSACGQMCEVDAWEMSRVLWD